MITDEIKAKVFAQYLGQKVKCVSREDDIPEVTDFIVNIFKDELIGVGNYEFYFNEDDIKLLLKPLSSITDEDAIEVTKILDISYSKTGEQEYYDLAGFVDYIENEFFNEKIYSVKSIIILTQFLQSKGYDLPNYLLDGKTLFESGLAIYE